MGLDVNAKTTAPRASVHPNLSDQEKWSGHIEEWLDATYPEMKISSWLERPEPDMVTLGVQLHPGASGIEFTRDADSSFWISARTSAAGPGYHAFVCRLIKKFASDHGVELVEDECSDDTEYFFTADKTELNNAFLNWLGQLTGSVLKIGPTALGARLAMVISNDRFEPEEGSVLTQLGPRDVKWLEKTVSDASQGTDMFPWWDEDLDGNYYRGRALCHMWSDVRWRKPVTDDEKDLLNRVLKLLDKAHDLNKALIMPWQEWLEIMDYLEVTGPTYDRVKDKAAENPSKKPVGYRRRPVTVNLPGGWQVRVPGSFAETWTDEGTTFYAYDEGRSLKLTTYSATGESTNMSAEEILSRPQYEELSILHSHENIESRASLEEPEDGSDAPWSLSGACATTGRIAHFDITFANDEDKDWAYEAWHSIKYVPPRRALTREW